MSLKAKLVSTIAAFCMVICLLSVGIWAASSGTVNIGGTVSFEVTDVNVLIEGTVTGMDGAAPTLKDIDWNAEDGYNTDTDSDSENDALVEGWALGALSFKKNAQGELDSITLTIDITNRSTVNAAKATLEVIAPTSGDVKVEASSAVNIQPTKTGQLTLTISTEKDANNTIDPTQITAKLVVEKGTIESGD